MGSSASTSTRRSTTAQSTVVTSLSVVTTPLSPVRPKPCKCHPTPTSWAVRKTPWDTSNALCPRDLRSTSSKRSITTRRSSDSPQGSTPACQRPKIDEFKALDNDKKILRFTARFNTRVPEDFDRRFIISFYLSDDTISIYEPLQKNSGIVHGKFLERNPYKNVDKLPAIITPTDMPLGGDVKINGYSFHILSADEYTTTYLNQYYV